MMITYVVLGVALTTHLVILFARFKDTVVGIFSGENPMEDDYDNVRSLVEDMGFWFLMSTAPFVAIVLLYLNPFLVWIDLIRGFLWLIFCGISVNIPFFLLKSKTEAEQWGVGAVYFIYFIAGLVVGGVELIFYCFI